MMKTWTGSLAPFWGHAVEAFRRNKQARKERMGLFGGLQEAFGTRQTKFPVDGWTKTAGEWMGAEGFLKAAK